jgi:hypothetical protein
MSRTAILRGRSLTFDELITTWNWQPIRNCPGRYILSERSADSALAVLLGTESKTSEFQVEAARDTVVIAQLDQGGLISYKRADGSYLHTLNTPEGFKRKLLQLGIELGE